MHTSSAGVLAINVPGMDMGGAPQQPPFSVHSLRARAAPHPTRPLALPPRSP